MKTLQNPMQLFDTASSTFTYIVFDAASCDAIIIDPVDTHLARHLAILHEHHLRLCYVLETHAHADHITSAAALIEHTGAQAATPIDCAILPSVIQLKHQDVLQLVAKQFKLFTRPATPLAACAFCGAMGYLPAIRCSSTVAAALIFSRAIRANSMTALPSNCLA
jgi:sulfur dioxygenase